MTSGVDLNDERQFWQSFGFSPGGGHEHRQDAVCATEGCSARLRDIEPKVDASSASPTRQDHWHPNQSNPAPSIVIGRLWGAI